MPYVCQPMSDNKKMSIPHTQNTQCQPDKNFTRRKSKGRKERENCALSCSSSRERLVIKVSNVASNCEKKIF